MALNFLPQKRCVCIFATKMAYNLSLVSNAIDNSFLLSIFIGVRFDRKLNLFPHIKYIKYNCRKAYYNSCALYPAVIGVVTELRIYQSHIRSKMDYGCIAYGSTRRPYLTVGLLDPIANQEWDYAPGHLEHWMYSGGYRPALFTESPVKVEPAILHEAKS